MAEKVLQGWRLCVEPELPEPEAVFAGAQGQPTPPTMVSLSLAPPTASWLLPMKEPHPVYLPCPLQPEAAGKSTSMTPKLPGSGANAARSWLMVPAGTQAGEKHPA